MYSLGLLVTCMQTIVCLFIKPSAIFVPIYNFFMAPFFMTLHRNWWRKFEVLQLFCTVLNSWLQMIHRMSECKYLLIFYGTLFYILNIELQQKVGRNMSKDIVAFKKHHSNLSLFLWMAGFLMSYQFWCGIKTWRTVGTSEWWHHTWKKNRNALMKMKTSTVSAWQPAGVKLG